MKSLTLFNQYLTNYFKKFNLKSSSIRLQAVKNQNTTYQKGENKLINFSDTYEQSEGKTSKNYHKMFLLFGAFLAYNLTCKTLHLIEDNQLRALKTTMTNEISRLRNQYGQLSVYPQIKYDMRGHCYTIQFQIDQRKTDIFLLLTKCMTHYNNEKGFRILDQKGFLNKDGLVTFYIDFQEQDPQFKSNFSVILAPQKGRITITGVQSNQRPSFRLILEKNDTITPKNTQLLVEAYKQSVKPKQVSRQTQNPHISSPHRAHIHSHQHQKQQQKTSENVLYKKLQQFGVTVFDPKDKQHNLDWDYLAGYQSQKRSIEDTVLLALNYPQIYDEITEATRVKFQQNRPKAVLFEGPPGTGKTTSAKIIAQQVNIPLIYMPIEAIMSKYYGESENRLAEFWQNCKKLGKVIIFIDEIDALAGSRDSDMHEASRRVLSTLLRKIDSFESTTDVLLICATNRKQDLDQAMLSRIDLSIKFSLPDKHSRAAIFRRYAKHLKNEDLSFLAEETQGFSGRNISDVCKHAQRKWASKLIRKQVDEKLPTLDQYISSLEQRKLSELVL